MHPIVPDWLMQVAGGLKDGGEWFVQKVRGKPTVLRYSWWVVLQAILFKIQPYLWQVLLDVVEFVTGVFELRLNVQLLLLVLLFLSRQTALSENRFKRYRKVVESMDNSLERVDGTATDGGVEIRREHDPDDRRLWRVYVVCGAIAGGAIGVGWGPAGTIGLAVLGAMIGHDWAQRVLEE
jgi:hypothetical protein